jgi:cytochrome P450
MSSVRLVLEDTIIADQYLLKKGSIVQVPAPAVHTDPRIWGSDVAEFNPRRFAKSLNGTFVENGSAGAEKKEKQVHPSAFRGFGGGSSLCPGRHFAQIEVLSFTAMLALGYELEPVEGDKLMIPKPLEPTLPLSVYKPEKDLMVNIRLREGLEGVKWVFEK